MIPMLFNKGCVNFALILLLSYSFGYSASPLSFTIHNQRNTSEWNLNYSMAGYHHNLNKAYAEIRVTIPFANKTPGPHTVRPYTSQTNYLSDDAVEQKQKFSTEVSIAVPFLDGLAFLDYGENLGLSAHSFIENASMRVDTTIAGLGSANFMATHSSNLALSQSWKTIRFGYILKSSKISSIGFTLNRHWFNLQSEGNYHGTLSGDILKQNSLGTTRYQLDYSTALYNGTIHADYEGGGWSPELSIKYRFIRLEAKFQANFAIQGSSSLSHTTPYLIDNLSLQSKYTVLDSLFSQESLLNASENKSEHTTFTTESGLRFKTPNFYTLELEVLDSTLYFNYTKSFGSYHLIAEQDSLDRASDHDARKYLTFKATPDHISLIRAYFKYGYVVGGSYVLKSEAEAETTNKFITYFQEENPFEAVTSTIFVPLLYGGILIGDTTQFELQLHAFPIAKLKLGVRYEF